ncbi:hypothetical protein [Flavisolibacter tropicus]|uniref:hypothetical protein n=1 Tax=Flavisolibacter tropicus TaxID=1492898 RepID=UPI0008331DA0|nr:hypothetical protein [Flavisolibacter tropicus]
MKKLTLLLMLIALYNGLHAQKVESIHFNLYTDSLKKGFYNYINIDGKFTDGSWQPLDSSQITFLANTGFFKGNDLFIDSSYKGEKVTVKAILKNNPQIWKEVTIYIRKRGFDEPLKTNEEILDEMMRSNQRKKRTDRNA